MTVEHAEVDPTWSLLADNHLEQPDELAILSQIVAVSETIDRLDSAIAADPEIGNVLRLVTEVRLQRQTLAQLLKLLGYLDIPDTEASISERNRRAVRARWDRRHG